MTAIEKITERALIKRINRRLAHENERLCITRGDRWRSTLGDYYVVDLYRNTVTAAHVDPEALGREIGAIRAHEEVVSDGS